MSRKRKRKTSTRQSAGSSPSAPPPAHTQTPTGSTPARPRFEVEEHNPRFAGYDAAQDEGKRLAPRVEIKNEDDILKSNDRRKLIATTHDQRRNFTLAAWMIRTHIALICGHSFQATTADPGFNAELEAFVERRGYPENCDVLGMNNLDQMIELMEAGRLVDGDCYLEKRIDGRAKGLEGNRIGNPARGELPEWARERDWKHGVLRNQDGRATHYCIGRRESPWNNALTFEKIARADSLIPLGFYDRFDQGRGISPLAAAVNQMQDLQEGLEYSLVKAKIQALFGMVIKRTAPESIGAGFNYQKKTATETTSDDDSESTTATAGPKYKVKFGRKPIKLELREGDDIDTVESRTPSHEFQAFTDLEIQLIMLALDLPKVFYDSTRGSYTIDTAATARYSKLAKPKRERVRQVRNRWTLWQVARAILKTGELSLPAGWTLNDVTWSWEHDGDPWIHRKEEIEASILKIQAGFSSPQQEAKRFGGNFAKLVAQYGEALQMLRDAECPVDVYSRSFAPLIAAQTLGGSNE